MKRSTPKGLIEKRSVSGSNTQAVAAGIADHIRTFRRPRAVRNMLQGASVQDSRRGVPITSLTSILRAA